VRSQNDTDAVRRKAMVLGFPKRQVECPLPLQEIRESVVIAIGNESSDVN
jgi:hypothetical protein